jgi:hypothetical protein
MCGPESWPFMLVEAKCREGVSEKVANEVRTMDKLAKLGGGGGGEEVRRTAT